MAVTLLALTERVSAKWCDNAKLKCRQKKSVVGSEERGGEL